MEESLQLAMGAYPGSKEHSDESAYKPGGLLIPKTRGLQSGEPLLRAVRTSARGNQKTLPTQFASMMVLVFATGVSR